MNTILIIAATVVSLNGLWDFKMEKNRPLEDVALPAFAADDKMIVPGNYDL